MVREVVFFLHQALPEGASAYDPAPVVVLNIERALKKFKRKFEKTGAVREMRSRKNFEKPSVKKRMALQKAIYVQKLRLQEEQ